MRLSLEPNRAPDMRIAAVDTGTPCARAVVYGSTEPSPLGRHPCPTISHRLSQTADPLLHTRVDGVTLALVLSILSVLYTFIL